MKKLSIFLISILMISLVAAGMIIPANENAKENAQAPEKSPVIGEDWDLERVDFIHYAKPSGVGKPGNGADVCYKLMGVKWNSLSVDYAVNPSNPYGLNENEVMNAVSVSGNSWDDATSVELLNAPSVDYSAVYGIQNYENAIDFGNLDSGIIGVTSVWYTRRGKQIVEFDMRLNTDYVWGNADLNPSVMDLQNILTHELGHSVGMDDIYSTSCSTVTMYGYSSLGDREKRTLEQPDITGLQKMYGI